MINARAASCLGIGFGAKQFAAIGLLPVAASAIIAHGSSSQRVRIRHAKKSIQPVEKKIQHAVEMDWIDYRQQDAVLLEVIMLFVTEMDK